MKASLADQPRSPASVAENNPPQALLCPAGARVILGKIPRPGLPVVPIAANATTLFAPRAACLVDIGGPLLVADTGHHRVLIWDRIPARDGMPADCVLGHADFTREGRNGNGDPTAATLNVPTAIAFGSGVLAVADAWNHRVLLWHGIPQRAGQPADVVLGQPDFSGALPNRGRPEPRADTMHWCYGVAIADGKLIVADTGNRRVLVWGGVPHRNGTAADLVLGQPDFASRDQGAGSRLGAHGMVWPHAVVVAQVSLFVADAGASRIMVWSRFPTSDGAGCDFVLGQGSFAGGDHNRGASMPAADSVNMPYGITRLGEQLAVADTANSRLLGFSLDSLAIGTPATALSGQPNFTQRGDNRWQNAARDSVSWPYGIAGCGTCAVIADSGNDRVLLWDTA